MKLCASYSRLPHSFDPIIAKDLGVNAALMIYYISIQIGYNKTKRINFIKGKTWMTLSQREMTEYFLYWSEDVINNVLMDLEKKGIIVKDNFNESPFDRTLWYAFVEEME